MTIDGDMILVTALIRPHMERHVVRILHDLPDFPAFTFTEVRGQGRGRGQGGAYVSSESDLTYHRFLELRLVCSSERAGEKISGRIAAAVWTGRKGDGVVLTTPVHTFARIREIGRHSENRDD